MYEHVDEGTEMLITTNKRALVCLLTLFVIGCAAHVETHAINSQTLEPVSGRSVSGIVYHAPQYVKVTHAFRTLVSGGKVVGTADDGGCVETLQKEEIRIMPDLAKAFVVRQTGGFLAGNKLSVTLDNGMLASVNSESTPQTADVLAATADVLGVVMEGVRPEEGPHACNAGPEITDFTRYELADDPRKAAK